MQYRKQTTTIRRAKSITTLSWAAAAIFGVLINVDHAHAEIMAEFTGTVEGFSGPSAIIDFFDGEIVGSYNFDETTPDSDGSVNLGSYAAITDYQVEFSSGYNVSSTSGDILIEDTSIGTDLYQVFSNSLNGSPSSILGVALSPKQMQLQLSDSSGAALSSDALPTSLDLSDLDAGEFTLSLDYGFFDIDITAELTSFSIVPEPASLALTSFGVLSVLCQRQRRLHAD